MSSKENKDIEKDFRDVAEKINAKLKEAADALKVANSLAKRHGKNLSSDAYDYDTDEELYNYYPLFEQLRAAGWSTSSMNC